MGFRKGDNAPLALVTLMDRAEEGVTAPGGDDKKAEKKTSKKPEASKKTEKKEAKAAAT
jgi:hypothetical protein